MREDGPVAPRPRARRPLVRCLSLSLVPAGTELPARRTPEGDAMTRTGLPGRACARAITPLVCTLLCLLPAVAPAQPPDAGIRVSGVVRDTSGAPVPDAVVIVVAAGR